MYTAHIVTPFKGPSHFIEECISSVKSQTYSSIQHHVIIDHDNKGACRNHYEALQKIEPNEKNIIFHLDGDDKLIDVDCISYLISLYEENPSLLATYGDYISEQGSICGEKDDIDFRDSILLTGWRYSHLRTFRSNLIPHLKENDMKDLNGQWYSSCADLAIFCPILELAGKDRVKFINRKLVYYRIHPGNDHATKNKLNDQIRCAIEIAKKPKYKKL